MNDRERLELIDAVLDDIDSQLCDSVLLIEGIKDKRALEPLIGEFECFMVQREGGPLRAAEYVSQQNKRAIILTDWDNKGEYLAYELESQLKALCVPFDSNLRKRLADLCRKDIKDIESLNTMYRRLTEKCAEYDY
ncbi:MAG: Toprim subdomain protein [Candidatus Methanomethylophilaceae archaeon]|nr:Toprim subdomain protein [Candidatus Methanomethylophilaceae archaeon]MBR7124742.1 Toprim subdomain protein [Candidatus Methanomethylophilaceae archaeon]